MLDVEKLDVQIAYPLAFQETDSVSHMRILSQTGQ